MIVLTGILLSLLLIGLIPVGVCVTFDDGDLSVRIAAGAAKLTVYPRKPKDKKIKRKKEKSTKRPPAAKKKLAWAELEPVVRLVLDVAESFPRKLLVRELTLHAVFGGKDAAQAAIGYGRAWAVIGAIIPVLEYYFRIQKRDVRAQLDYEVVKLKVYLRLDVRVRIGAALKLAWKAGVRFLKLQLQKKKKAVQANESSSV